MPAPKQSVIVGKNRDGMVDDVLVIDPSRVLVGDIELVTAYEPDA